MSRRLVVSVALAAVAATGAAFAAAEVWGADSEPTTGPSRGAPVTGPSASTVAPDASAEVPQASAPPQTGCGEPTATVTTADELHAALATAAAGDVITMAPGVYEGQFVATTSGTAASLITLCGGADAVIDGGGTRKGYGFHLDGAQYWHLQGFTVTNAQKGVMADGTVGSVIEGLTVHHIGDEAIHLRRHSTDNVVRGSTIYDTGNRREKFGEGVYVGTATSNWCDITDCEPDRSDRNLVEHNTIYDVTAEAVDIKEGTTGGIVRANTFDGSSLVEDGADSWVDVKGNDWLIEDNVGENSTMDGFQVHDVEDGWGRGNLFRGNTAVVNGPGFGFSLTPPQDNVVECANTVTGADEGFSNEPCR